MGICDGQTGFCKLREFLGSDFPLRIVAHCAMAYENHWLLGFQAIRSRLFWQCLIRQTWETEND
jgi:hypothetical protein